MMEMGRSEMTAPFPFCIVEDEMLSKDIDDNLCHFECFCEIT